LNPYRKAEEGLRILPGRWTGSGSVKLGLVYSQQGQAKEPQPMLNSINQTIRQDGPQTPGRQSAANSLDGNAHLAQ